MYRGLHVKYRYSCPTLTKFEFSRQFFEKFSNIKFHENLSRWIRVVPYGRTEGRADMTKLIVACRNFSIPPKN
jgi:hypothetical protein